MCEKGVAKDNNASLGDRATAAKDAMGDKMDETSHDVSPHPLLLCRVGHLSNVRYHHRQRRAPTRRLPSTRALLIA